LSGRTEARERDEAINRGLELLEIAATHAEDAALEQMKRRHSALQDQSSTEDKPSDRHNSGREGDDPGIVVVKTLFDSMRVDSQWSTQEERGFTWWVKDFAQRVWAEEAIDDDGFTIYRVHARTDLWKNVPNTDEYVEKLNALSMHASMSGLIRPEYDPDRVQLATTVYVHEETLDWVKVVFGLAVAIQAADAQIRGAEMARLLGAQSDTSSHPVSGARPYMDDMLNTIKTLVAPLGREPSRWIAADFEQAAEALRGQSIPASSDKHGLTAEFLFQDPPSILQVSNEESQLGNGILSQVHVTDESGTRFPET
jgi:hypothetical protein